MWRCIKKCQVSGHTDGLAEAGCKPAPFGGAPASPDEQPGRWLQSRQAAHKLTATATVRSDLHTRPCGGANGLARERSPVAVFRGGNLAEQPFRHVLLDAFARLAGVVG